MSFVPPPSLLVRLGLFPARPHKARSFFLELTISPSIAIFVKFREKKLIMSNRIFGWTQRVFYEAPVESL